MTDYVSLAVDPAPTYAIYAPIVARVWSSWNYTPIFTLHRSTQWENPFGQIVLREIRKVTNKIIWMPTMPPQTVANTMRTSRLVTASFAGLYPDDLIMTSDVDMVPLNRQFFHRPDDDFFVLRALYERWLACKDPPPKLIEKDLAPGVFRFQMCYVGATVEIWRELLPLTVGDPVGSMTTLLKGLPNDSQDFDEAKLSHAMLSSPRVQGPLVTLDPSGVWKKGELTLIDPLNLPLLSSYYNIPRGMLRLGDLWQPGKGPPPSEALDFIPGRFTATYQPWWCFDATALYHPAEEQWLKTYREEVDAAFRAGGAALWEVGP